MDGSERWTPPLFMLFFVISGAELDLRVFADLAVVGIGVVYILSRSAGKILGANGSGKTTLLRCLNFLAVFLQTALRLYPILSTILATP